MNEWNYEMLDEGKINKHLLNKIATLSGQEIPDPFTDIWIIFLTLSLVLTEFAWDDDSTVVV